MRDLLSSTGRCQRAVPIGAGFIVFIVRQIFIQLNEARHQNSFYLIEKHKLCGEVTLLWQ